VYGTLVRAFDTWRARAFGSGRMLGDVYDCLWGCLVQLFLTSFSENLAVERIWLWGESEYHYDYVWRKIKLFIGLRI
jgi:hypothetical protein